MDKQGRLTKWEELELGATYEWVKGKAKYGRGSYYVIEQINQHEGWVGFRHVEGTDMVRSWNWQRRYRKVQGGL